MTLAFSAPAFAASKFKLSSEVKKPKPTSLQNFPKSPLPEANTQ
jgi:hypothetical protein